MWEQDEYQKENYNRRTFKGNDKKNYEKFKRHQGQKRVYDELEQLPVDDKE